MPGFLHHDMWASLASGAVGAQRSTGKLILEIAFGRLSNSSSGFGMRHPLLCSPAVYRSDGQPQLHVPCLCSREDTKILLKAFPSKVWFPLGEALVRLDQDEGNKNFSLARRSASGRTKAHLLWFVTQYVEASLGSEKWEQTQLHQLDQLRTGAARA